jgi:hypothetical protein
VLFDRGPAHVILQDAESGRCAASGERTGTGMPMTAKKIRVFTWSLDLPESDAVDFMSQLSSDEHQRARRLVKKEDALHFMAARAGLRMILGAEIGESPRDVTFQLSPSGKPRLANHGDMHFNLSHSSGHAVLVLSRQQPVGIDIERIRHACLRDRDPVPVQRRDCPADPCPGQRTHGFARRVVGRKGGRDQAVRRFPSAKAR